MGQEKNKLNYTYIDAIYNACVELKYRFCEHNISDLGQLLGRSNPSMQP